MAILLVVLLSLLAQGTPPAVSAASQQAQSDVEETPQSDSRAPALHLSLRPGKEKYDTYDVERASVSLIARFENRGKEDILLAHPNICFPHVPQEGESLVLDEEKSHLSLVIRAPDGTTVRLRNNRLRSFEPGNTDHLMIKAGEAQEVRLGWLGPYFSLGQWVGIERPLFASPGAYQVWLSYKNEYPVALILDEDRERTSARPWMGELKSGPATVMVE